MGSVRPNGLSGGVGRKGFDNRLEEVDASWSRSSAMTYRLYPHRGGYLYDQIREFMASHLRTELAVLRNC